MPSNFTLRTGPLLGTAGVSPKQRNKQRLNLMSPASFRSTWVFHGLLYLPVIKNNTKVALSFSVFLKQRTLSLSETLSLPFSQQYLSHAALP